MLNLSIDFAPDQGSDGAARFPIQFDLNGSYKSTQVVLFNQASSVLNLNP